MMTGWFNGVFAAFMATIVFVFASVFKGFKKNSDLIQKEMKELKEKKEQAQPTRIKTSGSTFKNPIGQSDKKVWQLIKESVSIDKSFGDAHISEKHCNFFVNRGNATYEDMSKLIDFVSKKVFEKDMLFATLDPTTRRLSLPGGEPVLLSDTVGFIRDLPHHLVASFKATLEEVRQARLLLHVVDGTRPDPLGDFEVKV